METPNPADALDQPAKAASKSRVRLLLILVGGGAALLSFSACTCGGLGVWWWYSSSNPKPKELARPNIVVPVAGPGSPNEAVAVQFRRHDMKIGDVRFVSATHERIAITSETTGMLQKENTFVKFRGKVKTRNERDPKIPLAKGEIHREIAFLEVEEFKITKDGVSVFDLKAGHWIVPRAVPELTGDWLICAPDGVLTLLESPYNTRLQLAVFDEANLGLYGTDEKHVVGGSWRVRGFAKVDEAQVTFTGVKNEDNKVYLEFFGKTANEKKDLITTFLAKVPHGAEKGVSHLTYLRSEARVEELGDVRSGRLIRRTQGDVKVTYEMTYLPADPNLNADPWGVFVREGGIDRGTDGFGREMATLWCVGYTLGTPRPNTNFVVQAVASNRPDVVFSLALDDGKGATSLSFQKPGSFKAAHQVELKTLGGVNTFDLVVRSAPDAANLAQGKEIYRLKGISLK